MDLATRLHERGDTRLLTDALSGGHIPLRVVHNDAKLSNVLLCPVSSAPIAVLDWDTVMPGTLLFDVGDMVRSAVCLSAEDEPDVSKAVFRLNIFESVMKGYMHDDQRRVRVLEDETGGEGTINVDHNGESGLTATEIELLPHTGRVITLEQGIRFLTDHLAGDVYYGVGHEGHNLERARVQFAIVEQMEQLQGDIERITRALFCG